MGEMAEYYLEREMICRGAIESSKRKQKQVTWTSSDGRTWRPSEMEDAHLINVIHLVERREGNRGIDFLNNAPTYRVLVHELIKRNRLTTKYFNLSIEQRLSYKI